MTCSRLMMPVVFGLFFALAPSARGDLIEFRFGGVLYNVEGMLPEPWQDVTVGSTFELGYVFDSEAEDVQPDPSQGYWLIEYGWIALDGAPLFAEWGEINLYTWPLDEYYPFLFNLPNGASGNVDLYGSDVFDSDALPLTLDLEAFDLSRHFEVVGAGGAWEAIAAR